MSVLPPNAVIPMPESISAPTARRQSPFSRFIRPLATLFLLSGAALLPPAHADQRPWSETDVSVEHGLLWQVGKSTPLSYRLMPTQVSWRSREALGWQFDSGRLAVRNRATLFATWIQQGPESHYIGVSGSPSIEWWNRRGNWCAYTGAGGGVGWLDSQGVSGGQGQDFTLNWFARAGIEHIRSRYIRWSAGVMFQHMSNGGQTNPNPGIDALGVTLGWAWSF